MRTIRKMQLPDTWKVAPSVFIGLSIADVANQRILLEEFLVPCVRVNLRFFTKHENGRH